jgi:hypothetical protein
MSGEASGSRESSRLFCDRLKIPARISVSKPGTNEAELGLHLSPRNNDFLPDQSSEVSWSRNGLRGSLGRDSVLDRIAIPNFNLYNLEGRPESSSGFLMTTAKYRPTIADSLLSVQSGSHSEVPILGSTIFSPQPLEAVPYPNQLRKWLASLFSTPAWGR